MSIPQLFYCVFDACRCLCSKNNLVTWLLEKYKLVITVARALGVLRKEIYLLKRSAESMPTEIVPQRKSGSGVPKKTTSRIDRLLKNEMNILAITTVALKIKHPELLQNVASRTICHHLQKGLGLPICRAARKLMLTVAMNKERLNLCKKYQD